MISICMGCEFRILEEVGNRRRFVCTKNIVLSSYDKYCSSKVETDESKRVKRALSPVIDEIIQKSPHGGKLWKHRLKQKYAAQNDISQNEDSKKNDEPVQDHPKQTYFNFEEEYTNE